jgi:hypothetical protein
MAKPATGYALFFTLPAGGSGGRRLPGEGACRRAARRQFLRNCGRWSPRDSLTDVNGPPTAVRLGHLSLREREMV